MTTPDAGRVDAAGFRPARLGRTPTLQSRDTTARDTTRDTTTRDTTTRDTTQELADIERGRTDALLGALGRIQLRLEVLTREQQEHGAALRAVERRLAALEQPPPPPPISPQP